MNEQSPQMAAAELINTLEYVENYLAQVCRIWYSTPFIEEHYTTEQLEALNRQAVSFRQGLKDILPASSEFQAGP